MIILCKSNNAVTVSFILSLLKDADIDCLVLDEHMSLMEGSIGIFPRRIMVTENRLLAARNLLRDAGLADILV